MGAWTGARVIRLAHVHMRSADALILRIISAAATNLAHLLLSPGGTSHRGRCNMPEVNQDLAQDRHQSGEAVPNEGSEAAASEPDHSFQTGGTMFNKCAN